VSVTTTFWPTAVLRFEIATSKIMFSSAGTGDVAAAVDAAMSTVIGTVIGTVTEHDEHVPFGPGVTLFTNEEPRSTNSSIATE